MTVTRWTAVTSASLLATCLATTAAPTRAADLGSLVLQRCDRLPPPQCSPGTPGAPPRFEQASVCVLNAGPPDGDTTVQIRACLRADLGEVGLSIPWSIKVGLFARDAARGGYALVAMSGQGGQTQPGNPQSLLHSYQGPIRTADIPRLVDRAVVQLVWHGTSPALTTSFFVPVVSPR